jgi:hypothetical protein
MRQRKSIEDERHAKYQMYSGLMFAKKRNPLLSDLLARFNITDTEVNWIQNNQLIPSAISLVELLGAAVAQMGFDERDAGTVEYWLREIRDEMRGPEHRSHEVILRLVVDDGRRQWVLSALQLADGGVFVSLTDPRNEKIGVRLSGGAPQGLSQRQTGKIAGLTKNWHLATSTPTERLVWLLQVGQWIVKSWNNKKPQSD